MFISILSSNLHLRTHVGEKHTNIQSQDHPKLNNGLSGSVLWDKLERGAFGNVVVKVGPRTERPQGTRPLRRWANNFLCRARMNIVERVVGTSRKSWLVAGESSIKVKDTLVTAAVKTPSKGALSTMETVEAEERRSGAPLTVVDCSIFPIDTYLAPAVGEPKGTTIDQQPECRPAAPVCRSHPWHLRISGAPPVPELPFSPPLPNIVSRTPVPSSESSLPFSPRQGTVYDLPSLATSD
ncbi:hypothetical protein EW145_g939 [Phellinidium pouzarii]|uniref:Uncharacterized protein n=1 Tax=Phellinidium pouzarii TaxID=167371 RepID=A0A4S4LIC0_9AGAM|nr:hypothetical protein EW145_g939 [Phellinidium pouzarii]